MKDKGRICAIILVAMFAILFLTGCTVYNVTYQDVQPKDHMDLPPAIAKELTVHF
tara:strand:+ start:158 stop:322 length:165 start_codon:yes stop_codon:yes gene_type:complete